MQTLLLSNLWSHALLVCRVVSYYGKDRSWMRQQMQDWQARAKRAGSKGKKVGAATLYHCCEVTTANASFGWKQCACCKSGRMHLHHFTLPSCYAHSPCAFCKRPTLQCPPRHIQDAHSYHIPPPSCPSYGRHPLSTCMPLPILAHSHPLSPLLSRRHHMAGS